MVTVWPTTKPCATAVVIVTRLVAALAAVIGLALVPERPARSLLNVVVLLTDSVALPVSVAAFAKVMLLPARARGSWPPLIDTGLVRLTALLAWRTPLDRETGPVPRAVLLPSRSEPVTPAGLDRKPSGTSTLTLLLSGPW